MTIQFLRFGLIVVKFSIRANTEIFERMKNLMPRILISGWQVRYFQLNY
jgi:hypothetical protein